MMHIVLSIAFGCYSQCVFFILTGSSAPSLPGSLPPSLPKRFYCVSLAGTELVVTLPELLKWITGMPFQTQLTVHFLFQECVS